MFKCKSSVIQYSATTTMLHCGDGDLRVMKLELHGALCQIQNQTTFSHVWVCNMLFRQIHMQFSTSFHYFIKLKCLELVSHIDSYTHTPCSEMHPESLQHWHTKINMLESDEFGVTWTHEQLCCYRSGINVLLWG